MQTHQDITHPDNIRVSEQQRQAKRFCEHYPHLCGNLGYGEIYTRYSHTTLFAISNANLAIEEFIEATATAIRQMNEDLNQRLEALREEMRRR